MYQRRMTEREPHQTLLVQSDASSGKSKWLVRLFEQTTMPSVLLVTDSRVQASVLAAELQARGIQCSLDVRSPQSRVLVIDLEALHELGNDRMFGLVVLEQITVLLRRFQMLDNQGQITFDVLTRIVKRTNIVVGADAYINERAIWFMLRVCKREHCEVYEDQYFTRMSFSAELQHKRKDAAVQEVIKAVQDGFRVAIACESSVHAKEIQSRISSECQGKKGVLYTNEMGKKEEDNKLWADLDYLIYSPAANAVVNWANSARPFDRMVCLLKNPQHGY